MASPRILSVGQCGFDHEKISRPLQQSLNAEVHEADTLDEALRALRARPFDLVLVNRIFDADGAPGVDLIRAIKAVEALSKIPVMLVSNYPDAQAEAVALGGVQGFGKAELSSPGTLARLRAVLGAEQPA